MITTSNESEPMPTDANLLDSPIAKKWEQEEGYTRNDLLEAQAIMRKEGIPEDRMNDPGIVRRYLLPRVVTLVQISEIILPENTSPDTEIDFQLKGAVPTPEFNFVRFDIVRQDDVIRIRALGHSPASPPDGSESAMLPIELSGKLDPLPPGIYRIIIPDLGMSGTKILEVR